MPNHLVDSSSPYLRQHKDNPVDWYPWCNAAFERARAEDKPIFLSVGYSACHWCHVMEHESFENEQLAAILNEHFISIKVDREERPDVDQQLAPLGMTLCLSGDVAEAELQGLCPLVANRTSHGGEPTLFVCRDSVCELPLVGNAAKQKLGMSTCD